MFTSHELSIRQASSTFPIIFITLSKPLVSFRGSLEAFLSMHLNIIQNLARYEARANFAAFACVGGLMNNDEILVAMSANLFVVCESMRIACDTKSCCSDTIDFTIPMRVCMVKVNVHLALLFFCRWFEMEISRRLSSSEVVVDDDDWDSAKTEEDASGYDE